MRQIVDLRSDTVTKPTAAMREAMASAPVGDDVFGEDPMVNELQRRVAEMTGKEAALFVPSGTMSNQIALFVHTKPGDEVICEYGCHIFNYEGAGAAQLSGVQLHPLKGERGVITAQQIAEAIRPADHHYPRTALIEVENTHNRAGGAVFPLSELRRIRALADERGLTVHMDGARLWNAVVATGIPLAEWCRTADSVSLCFSKGLGAPVGSILVGSAEFIERAHRRRKAQGGGMRQAGILAAAALYALDHHIERLAEDHRRARALAEFLNEHGALVDLAATQTNIVIAELKGRKSAPQFCRELQENGVLALPISEYRVRFVTHLDVDDQGLEYAVKAIGRLLS
ncbi:MAG: low-specificity L-threonine aldolase [candidate division KSB1 bacterium]|nr:low-specificity L-threonine aldolase [candidate division KSB1 bacterium]